MVPEVSLPLKYYCFVVADLSLFSLSQRYWCLLNTLAIMLLQNPCNRQSMSCNCGCMVLFRDIFQVRDLQFDSQYNTHGGFKQYLKNKPTKSYFFKNYCDWEQCWWKMLCQSVTNLCYLHLSCKNLNDVPGTTTFQLGLPGGWSKRAFTLGFVVWC